MPLPKFPDLLDDDPVEALRSVWRYTKTLIEYYSPLKITFIILLLIIGSAVVDYAFTRDAFEVLSWGADLAPVFISILGIVLSVKKMNDEQHGAFIILLIIAGLAGSVALHVTRIHDQKSLNARLDAANTLQTSIMKRLSTQPVQTDSQKKVTFEDILRSEYILSHKHVSQGILDGTEPLPADWMHNRLEQLGQTSSTEQPPPAVSSPAWGVATVGSLPIRATQLADEIMDDMTRNGWRTNTPSSPEAAIKWDQDRSWNFRYHYYDRVKAIRDEFTALHFTNKHLDDFIRTQDQTELYEKQSPPPQPGHGYHSALNISPWDIVGTSNDIRSLVKQISPENYREPESLSFTAKTTPFTDETIPLDPHEAKYSFRTITTISTQKVVSSGYIIVEFSVSLGPITPRPGGDMTMGNDRRMPVAGLDTEITNKNLLTYLAQKRGRYYIFDIGNQALTPQSPIHVTFDSYNEVHVTRVTLF